MISEQIAMAERQYDRWYVLGHSLGSIVAFNGVQETEWNLPNYLDPAQADRIKAGSLKDDLWLSDTPAGDTPNLNIMMPRRPVWLKPTERIAGRGLFKSFKGMITYGSPLDKFAALWPRIVPVNKDRTAFAEDADWVNLSDATDPVGAQIEAFAAGWHEQTAQDRSPFNLRVRASPFFLLSHIRYFAPPRKKGGDKPETRALVDVLFPNGGVVPRLNDAFASVGQHYGKPNLRALLAATWVVGLGLALVAGTSWLALLLRNLGDVATERLSQWLKDHWPKVLESEPLGFAPDLPWTAWSQFLRLFQWLPMPGFLGTMLTTFIVGSSVVIAAGIWRRFKEA